MQLGETLSTPNFQKRIQTMETIQICREIVASCTYQKIDGVLVDLFSASTIVQVFDALNPANQEKMASLPVEKMAALAFRLVA